MLSCPREGTLLLLGTDALGEGTYTAIEEHVEGCPECKAVLERLAHRRRDPKVVVPAPEPWPRIPGFEIQSELGRGGMGVVYLAIETGLDRPVALKVLPEAAGPEASAGPRRRWLREARAVSRVRHPNVVPLYDYGEADGWFFLVLEYVPGGTLKKRLTEPFPPRVAAGLMQTIARAVGYIHGRGLLHLDLKPSNILLDCEENGPWDRVTPRISDFGLALPNGGAGASETSLAGIRGTPSYMAPEQAPTSRAGVGAAADIHALGAILYELLTARPPFLGTSTLETLDQVRGQNPVPPRRLNPKLPRDLETIALKCLEKNPSRRYASAGALADDLRRWLDGKPISARPVSPIEHAWRWCRRQPVIAALAATLILTLFGSVLGLLGLLRSSETIRSRSEANYQVAARSLDELLTIFLDDDNKYRNCMSDGYLRSKAMETARSQEIELSRRYPPDIRGLRRLALIDEFLACHHAFHGKLDEALSLREESIGCWESCLALAPDDVETRRRLIGAVGSLVIHTAQGNDRVYDRWNARAIEMVKQLRVPHEVHVDEVFKLTCCHRHHANSLLSRGKSDRARKELEDDLNLVRSVPVAETAFAAIVLSEALTLAALGQWSGELTVPRSPVQWQLPSVEINDLELSLAELTASRIGWPPWIDRSTSLISNDLPLDAWVDRVISAIQSDATKFDLDRTRIPAIAWLMRRHCASTLAWHRRVGKLDDEHRLVDRLVALARRLTQSYPDQAATSMLLSEGYVQRAKIAYRVDDAAVIGWERQALDAANHAVTLEPENVEAHSLLENRRARLSKLASE
jgi:eukaryotic-like serine/threonine-protein kinase